MRLYNIGVSKMNQDRILELLVKRKTGEITLPEQAELSRLLIQNPEKETDAAILDEYFACRLQSQEISEQFVKNSGNKLKSLIEEKENLVKVKAGYSVLWRRLSVAASIIFIAGLLFLTLNRTSENKPLQAKNLVFTKKGSKTNLVLPGGTKVWVNADSRLVYSKSYGDDLREVYLTGEAFFDVAKDKEHPFIVHTQYMDVRALGTAFNVRAYSNDVSPQTTLIRGSVEVLVKESREKIILKPYEKLIVQNNFINNNSYNDITTGDREHTAQPPFLLQKLKPNSKDSTVLETQWVQNKLVFQKQNISELVPTLERWYNVKIIIKGNNGINNNLLSGTFDNDGLMDVLESLKLSAGIKYKISKDSVFIY